MYYYILHKYKSYLNRPTITQPDDFKLSVAGGANTLNASIIMIISIAGMLFSGTALGMVSGALKLYFAPKSTIFDDL